MKPDKRILILALIISGTLTSFAQVLQTGAWATFHGKIGTSYYQLSLFLFKDSTVKGNYVLNQTSQKVLLTGAIKGNSLNLHAVKQENLSLNGRVTSANRQDGDVYSGTFIDATKKTTVPFKFVFGQLVYGEYNHMYSDLFGTDDEIENYAAKVKQAIIASDKEWVASNIFYPFAHSGIKGHSVIANKKQMLAYYDKIFTPALKELLKKDMTTNLFTKDSKVMLGDGEIWISNSPNSTSKKYGFSIYAVNN